jgi:hypothetical protein
LPVEGKCDAPASNGNSLIVDMTGTGSGSLRAGKEHDRAIVRLPTRE